MKKYTLFVLVSLMTFNAFCLTQEETDKIYEAIVAEAKNPGKIRFISHLENFEFDENEYTNQLPNEITLENLLDLINKDKEEAEKAATYLRSLPPSILIPAFYELRLEGKLRLLSSVDRYAEVRLSETNKYDQSSILYLSKKKMIVRQKYRLNSVVVDYSRCETYLDGPFIKRVDKASYVGSLKSYWWLEGRRFMPEIWEDWYPCWKHEMSRKEPRTFIINKLTNDISCFGTFLFPYLYEAIKEGDDSLASILKEVKNRTAIALPSVDEFCEWYEKNYFKYDYPPCEGIRKAIERVTDPYVLSELKGEDTYDDKEKYLDKWAFGDLDRQMFKQILWKTEDYYKNREFPPNYWYYKIPDEEVIKNDSDFTNVMKDHKTNKRLLNKLRSKSE